MNHGQILGLIDGSTQLGPSVKWALNGSSRGLRIRVHVSASNPEPELSILHLQWTAAGSILPPHIALAGWFQNHALSHTSSCSPPIAIPELSAKTQSNMILCDKEGVSSQTRAYIEHIQPVGETNEA